MATEIINYENLDEEQRRMVDSDDWRERSAAASQGYALERLARDHIASVRAAVASHGYALDTLAADANDDVRSAAWTMLAAQGVTPEVWALQNPDMRPEASEQVPYSSLSAVSLHQGAVGWEPRLVGVEAVLMGDPGNVTVIGLPKEQCDAVALRISSALARAGLPVPGCVVSFTGYDPDGGAAERHPALIEADVPALAAVMCAAEAPGWGVMRNRATWGELRLDGTPTSAWTEIMASELIEGKVRALCEKAGMTMASPASPAVPRIVSVEDRSMPEPPERDEPEEYIGFEDEWVAEHVPAPVPAAARDERASRTAVSPTLSRAESRVRRGNGRAAHTAPATALEAAPGGEEPDEPDLAAPEPFDGAGWEERTEVFLPGNGSYEPGLVKAAELPAPAREALVEAISDQPELAGQALSAMNAGATLLEMSEYCDIAPVLDAWARDLAVVGGEVPVAEQTFAALYEPESGQPRIAGAQLVSDEYSPTGYAWDFQQRKLDDGSGQWVELDPEDGPWFDNPVFMDFGTAREAVESIMAESLGDRMPRTDVTEIEWDALDRALDGEKVPIDTLGPQRRRQPEAPALDDTLSSQVNRALHGGAYLAQLGPLEQSLIATLSEGGSAYCPETGFVYIADIGQDAEGREVFDGLGVASIPAEEAARALKLEPFASLAEAAAFMALEHHAGEMMHLASSSVATLGRDMSQGAWQLTDGTSFLEGAQVDSLPAASWPQAQAEPGQPEPPAAPAAEEQAVEQARERAAADKPTAPEHDPATPQEVSAGKRISPGEARIRQALAARMNRRKQ